LPTKNVACDGYYAGSGSKQTTVKCDGSSPIISVGSNLPSYTACGAVIENLIIDGSGSNGNFGNNITGVFLNNVCNCFIRNLTIKNCDVGIEIKNTEEKESFANRFEHIRLVNVKTGIKFTGAANNKNFHYTTIDDVYIGLKNDSSAVGIKIGDSSTTAKLYSAFIKANVNLGSSGGKGLEVNGELKYSLVNLEVKRDTNTGVGIQINSGAVVSDNQSFLLTKIGFDPNSSSIINNSAYGPDVVERPQ